MNSQETLRYIEKDSFISHNIPDNAINYYVSIKNNNNRILFADIIDTNIAYIRIRNLAGKPGDYPEFGNFFDELRSTEGLILDLRENGGGNGAIAKAFANRFAQYTTENEKVRFRNGPEHHEFGNWNELMLNPLAPIHFNKPIEGHTARQKVLFL